MRSGVIAACALTLLGFSFAILAGGQTLTGQPSNDEALSAPTTGGADEPATPAATEADPPRPSLQSRVTAPEKPEPLEKSAELERTAPREPLGDLGLAASPKKKADGGTILYRPVASAAGRIEAMGYSITLADIEALDADETCDFEGKTWPCGARARSAFRAFLRGRAVTCDVPPKPDGAVTPTTCRLGKQDVGAWLVENGWARATAGPYADASENARSAGKGMFGPPPAAVSLPALPASEDLAITPTDPSGPFQ
ncbi:thermonuclease family protein [Pseudaminobacter sp. NGMCC 1.201702]|uniref:thermonuclease family protein n=1 Tax=Pseudaminobacter sp. NGMCC 1.201702 TaxID=3391825 RepID=UPI0039F0066D